MVGVIKGLTFHVLNDSGAPPVMWSYAMLYCWNNGIGCSSRCQCTTNRCYVIALLRNDMIR